jgi:hypothetical protein
VIVATYINIDGNFPLLAVDDLERAAAVAATQDSREQEALGGSVLGLRTPGAGFDTEAHKSGRLFVDDAQVGP